MVSLLLHELRTPLSVAQGYLRLLVEDRLSDPSERRQAVRRSMEALGQISALCVGADELIDTTASLRALSVYEASALISTVEEECRVHQVPVILPSHPISGAIQFPALPDAGLHTAAILRTALRNCPALARMVHISVQQSDLVLTTGDDAHHRRLLASTNRAPFNPWHGGSGLLVPLALKYLSHASLRLWTLSDEHAGVAIAIPMRASA